MTYFCEKCNYKTGRKDGYQKHLKSKLHLNLVNGYDKKYKYECEFCSKKYIQCAGLSRHKRKCKIKKLKEKQEEEIQKLKIEISKTDAMIAKDKEIEKLRSMLEEKDKRLMEMTKNAGNNNNNTFNIQVFLDKECKDAMPIMDFIKDLQFKLTDINPERPASTIESLSKCITDKLEDMDETERPVHCTDPKRLVFHVKDASGWTKDVNNKKIDNALNVANICHQGAWRKKAQSENMVHQKNHMDYLNMNVAMGKWSDNPEKAKKKIKRAIAKNTYLPKNWSLQKSPAV